jgi:hypothetical protein
LLRHREQKGVKEVSAVWLIGLRSLTHLKAFLAHSHCPEAFACHKGPTEKSSNVKFMFKRRQRLPQSII